MSNQNPFAVYSASAGSGKTFTLVKEYLQIVLQNKDTYHFQKILAITFTNKAAAEMKERVISNLQSFARGDSSEMLQLIQQTIGLEAALIQKRAKTIIEAILRDYSAFNITTIDSFTHRIIRSFAYDFGLSLNFNVETDAKKLLQEAVDAVIGQIGNDLELTKALVAFSHQKSDDDKSWDIGKILFKFASILLNETDRLAFKSIADKSFGDYLQLQKKLKIQLATLEPKMQEIGESALQIIADAGVEQKDFYRSMLPKHFSMLSTNWEKAKFYEQSVLRKRIEENNFYSKSKSANVKAQIENILPQLLDLYLQSEQLFSRITLLKLFRENLIPLAVLSYIHKALEDIKETNNLRLISEFNELIFKKIQNEPTPFIYERIGEKFQYYFIDEMQDTSVLQWKNLAKLIENALAQEGGSLLLVGDAKQAIYRWRGGKSEQFIGLADAAKKSPFQVAKTIENLDTNFRSFTQIINFNNAFFQHISSLMQNENYAKLYLKGNQQKTNSKIGGYVQIELVKKEKDNPDNDILYPKKVLETIQNLDTSFEWKDVCVLVRKNSQGVAIASYLNENGVDIISSESLLLGANTKIDFLINLLQTVIEPKDEKSRFNLLDFLYEHTDIKTDKHSYFKDLIHLTEKDFYRSLQAYGYDFKKEVFFEKSLYDSIEYCIRSFKLAQTSNAYLQYFLDVVLDFQIKNGTDLASFLTYWEEQKDKLSISMPEGKNAVQIMTIHKAKGLQFPVVIFPYDLNIYQQIQPNIWYPIADPEQYLGFKNLLIPYRTSLQYTDDIGRHLYEERQEMLELDNYNLLYVTLTRAVEQLYIITDYKLNREKQGNTNYYSGLFINYLKANDLWDLEQQVYSFGEKTRVILDDKKEVKEPIIEVINSQKLISTDLLQHQVNLYASSSLLWDTEQGKAIAFGNLLHEILSQIKTADDIDTSLQYFLNQGIINETELTAIRKKVNAVVMHADLSVYYQHNLTVYCEREIVNSLGMSIIPDRIVVFPNKKAVIIDYKTGAIENKHKIQIKNYANYLMEMGYEVIEMLLVYIGDKVKVVAIKS